MLWVGAPEGTEPGGPETPPGAGSIRPGRPPSGAPGSRPPAGGRPGAPASRHPLRVGLLDRYLLRQIAPGFFLGTGVFLFALLLNELVRNIELLVTQGARPATIGLALAYLIPGLLVVAVPSALLLGILFALNRLSASAEILVMRAGGISTPRLLLPVAAASVLALGLSGALMLEVVPRSNQRFVEISADLLDARLRTEVEARIFYDELLDHRVLLVGETPPEGGPWRQVFLADLERPSEPTIFVAGSGQLAMSPENRVAYLALDRVEVHNAAPGDPGRYRIQTADEMRLPLDPESVFGPEDPGPRWSARAMRLPRLLHAWRTTEHPVYLVEIHKKFALPAACLAFGMLGLGLGLRPSAGSERAGAFVAAILVVLGYYLPLAFGEQLASGGQIPPWLAMWGANLLAAAAGILLLALASRELDPLAAVGRGLVRAVRFLLPRRRRFRRRATRRWRRPGLPTVLDRYVAGRFAWFLLLALLALVSVQGVGRLIAVIGQAFDREIPSLTVARFLLLSTPEFAAGMLPLATLAATLITFGVLTRDREVTAFLAGGISRGRLAIPALGVGLAASAAGLGLQEYVLPAVGPEAEHLSARIEGRAERTLDPLERHWGLGPAGDIYHYEDFDAANSVLTGLSIFSPAEGGGSLASRSFVGSAHWDEAAGAWSGIGGWRRDFVGGPAVTTFARREIPEISPPAAFLREDLAADLLPYRDLRDRIEVIESAGHRAPALHVDLHGKASLPLASLITVLIGVPFAFAQSNRGGKAGAAVALAIGIVYMVATQFFSFLGDAGVLDPPLAAWSPNLFFGLASAFLLFVRRD